jgi:hypothetical protein
MAMMRSFALGMSFLAGMNGISPVYLDPLLFKRQVERQEPSSLRNELMAMRQTAISTRSCATILCA